MIPGATAADEGDAPAMPAGPPTAIGTLDFVNNVYTWNSASRTLAQIVDLTARRSASGLEIIAGTPVQLIGDPLTFVLLANWTVAIEFAAVSHAGQPGRRLLIFYMQDTGLNNQVTFTAQGATTLAIDFFEDSGVNTRDAFGDNDYAVPSTLRVAGTRNTAHVAVSMGGETMGADNVTNTSMNISTWTFPPANVYLADGNESGQHEGYVRKITFYNPVADSQLPTMSA